jgi:hypothetical protein
MDKPEVEYGGEKPLSFARPRFGDFVSALRRVRSKQQEALREIAANVHQKLGMKTLAVRDAVHDSPNSASANTAQAVEHTNPATADYAAAQYGLLSQSPSLLVFHVGNGPDSVYKLSARGSGEKLRSQLDDHGLRQRTLLPTKTGYDVMLYDRGSKLQRHVENFANVIGSPVRVNRGRGEVIGDDVGAAAGDKARRNYRSLIRSYEAKHAATKPEPVSYPDRDGNAANSGSGNANAAAGSTGTSATYSGGVVPA